MEIQTVSIHDFHYSPKQYILRRGETFHRTFKRLLSFKEIGIAGDFHWHRQNPDGTETPVKLTYTDTPQSLGMHLNRVEEITWKKAGVFRAMKGGIV